jgi:hypothetical protein
MKEHRDLCSVRNVDCDAQLSRFRERNNGQTDTDQGWGVRFTQWLGSAKPESRVTREQVASPRETLDKEHGAWSVEHGAGSMDLQPPVVPRKKKREPQYPTESEAVEHCAKHFPTWHHSSVRDLYRHYVSTGWTDRDGKPVGNWKNKFSTIHGFKAEKGTTGPTKEWIDEQNAQRVADQFNRRAELIAGGSDGH